MTEDRSMELDDTVLPAAREDPSLDDTMGVSDPALDRTLAPHEVMAGSASGGVHEGDPKRYEVGPEVGRGGLGRVLSAHDAVFGRTVAIKELLDDDTESRRRFRREVLVTARLQHPSIVPIYDAGLREGRAPFYAMKFVAGQPLNEAILARTTLEGRLALLPNVLAVADAIAYAHDERVIHRDLKPHNVLIGAHGETIVIDWGLAKDLDAPDPESVGETTRPPADAHVTALGAMLGTPAYMAPEQVSGSSVDERADVYALGGMLYHVVSGTAPHEGQTLSELLDRVTRGDIVPLARREPRVPPELSAIVTKAMALSPRDRYRSARELALDLRRYTTDQMVGAYRYSLVHRARRWVVRNAVASLAVVLLFVFGTWTLVGIRRERADVLAGARLGLSLAASGTSRDVAFSLDQAAPMLADLRTLADDALPLTAVGPRMHDLALGRPGVSNVSIGFASGLFRGTFVPPDETRIDWQESVMRDGKTTRTNYRVFGDGLVPASEVVTDYDVRRRPHYELAEKARARVWTAPHIYFTSGRTGVTCTEPIYTTDGTLLAVTTVDFDVGALSSFVAHPPLRGARAVVFAKDGTVLAYPSAHWPDGAAKGGRLLRHEDFADPVLEALFARLGARDVGESLFLELPAAGEDYLASIAPVGGHRAGVAAPLDWYVATMAPASAFLGAALAREREARVSLMVALAMVAALVAASAWRTRSTRPRDGA